MNKTLKKLIVANIIVSLFVAAFIVYAYLVGGKEGYVCDFYTVTGLYCPGCGGSRALISLFKLDILSSFKYNIAVPFGIFVYVYYNVRGIIAAIKKDRAYFSRQKYMLCVAAALLLILNCIVKNVLLVGFGIGF